MRHRRCPATVRRDSTAPSQATERIDGAVNTFAGEGGFRRVPTFLIAPQVAAPRRSWPLQSPKPRPGDICSTSNPTPNSPTTRARPAPAPTPPRSPSRSRPTPQRSPRSSTSRPRSPGRTAIGSSHTWLKSATVLQAAAAQLSPFQLTRRPGHCRSANVPARINLFTDRPASVGVRASTTPNRQTPEAPASRRAQSRTASNRLPDRRVLNRCKTLAMALEAVKNRPMASATAAEVRSRTPTTAAILRPSIPQSRAVATSRAL